MSIQPIHSGSTHGFQVRVGPRHATLTRFFAVRKYGGARKALAQARAAEVELKKVAEPTAPRGGARSARPANNTSGLVGIRPRYELYSDHLCLYFVASWREGGKACSTSFSAEKHGLIGALKLAMARREEATGLRYDMTARKALNRMKHLITDK